MLAKESSKEGSVVVLAKERSRKGSMVSLERSKQESMKFVFMLAKGRSKKG